MCCDLLENSYLCGISNNHLQALQWLRTVVICLKIRTFVVSATTTSLSLALPACCDLLENSYLCGISNNKGFYLDRLLVVVICLKIRTFVVSATTISFFFEVIFLLWFAWKFVPLWYQQQLWAESNSFWPWCDLLENSYLCGISNNILWERRLFRIVVICLKIRTFVVSATTYS